MNFPNGALSGDVQFTLPAADINGTPLSGTVNWTVTVDDVAAGNGSVNRNCCVSQYSIID